MALKTNVLLIDDDTNVRQSLRQVLIMENFQVFTAANGLDAIWEFGQHRIDIVVLDINLGSESGWAAFEKLRSIRPHLPIIIMTARPQEHRPCPPGGVEVFMEKPLDMPGFLSKLEELSARGTQAEVAQTRSE